MPLHLRLVPSIDQAVAPLAALLAQPAEPFARELVVAPSGGIQQWLRERLARRLGAAPGRSDGIVAGVEMLFPGTLVARALGGRPDEDPWAIGPLTFALLDVLQADSRRLPPARRSRGLLPTARAMADLFDRYHFHRPAMVEAWAHGSAVHAPLAGGDAAPLEPHLRWQAELWQAVRERLDTPSPPERLAAALAHLRAGARPASLPARLAVVGVTALPPLVLDVLEALAGACDVHVWATHPAPGLAARDVARLAGHPPAPRVLREADPLRETATVPLLRSWCRPSQGLQVLLAGRRLLPPMPEPPADLPPGPTALARLQRALRSDTLAPTDVPVDGRDQSVQVHACHGPARQAEVLHDALVHAFKELDGLEPSDVLVVAPALPLMAPHLTAAFGDPWAGDRDPGRHLPLVVADRSLRDVHETAIVLGRLLDLPARRFGIADFCALASLACVQRRLDVSADTVDRWLDWADHLRVRWGLSAHDRARYDLPPDFEAHSWLEAARRLARGACLPDGASGGDGPLPAPGLDPGDLPSVGALLRLLGVLTALDAEAAVQRPVPAWADLLAETLLALTDVPPAEEAARARVLAELNRLRSDAAGSEVPVGFGEVAAVLRPALAGDAGRVNARSGAITATSLVPLRGVPYRVVCLVGLDDGVASGGDGEADDLLRVRPLVGDPDPRAEQRQALLETILSAGDRLIVTRTGRDPRTNVAVQPTTLLTELLELVAGVTGAARAPEIAHPRHAVSRVNFEPGKLLPVGPFGHDPAQARAAGWLSRPPVIVAAANVLAPPAVRDPVIEADDLVRLLVNPLDVYVRRTLGIDLFEGEDDDAATIPLALDTDEYTVAAAALLAAIRDRPADAGAVDAAIDAWQRDLDRRRMLPPGALADAVVAETAELVRDLQRQCAIKGIPLDRGMEEPVRLPLGDGRVVMGRIEGVRAPRAEAWTQVRVSVERAGDRAMGRQWVMTLLHGAHAGDPSVRSFWIGRQDRPKDRAASFARTGAVAAGVDATALRDRLHGLVTLLDEASAAPRPGFPGVAAKLLAGDEAKARAEFDRLVEKGLEPWRPEYRVFGADPDFDEVFTVDGIDFVRRLANLRTGTVVIDTSRKSAKRWPT